MPVLPIESYKDFVEIINGGNPVIIDFWATWCGPCRVISPVMEKFSNLAENTNVQFYKVDVDEQDQIAQEVGVRAMPTFIVFKDGNKVKDLVGADPRGLQNLVQHAVTLA